MGKRLFLIGNPTHYLNSIEYIYQADPEFENHLVMATEFVEGVGALKSMHSQHFWNSEVVDDIREYENEPAHWRSWRRVHSLMRNAIEVIRPDELVIGNLGAPIFYALVLKSNKKGIKIVVLDDGIPSISILRARNSGNFYRKYHFIPFRSALRLLLCCGQFLPLRRSPSSVVLFTLFRLKGSPSDLIVLNEYSWLKKKVLGSVDSSLAYFIGSHIVERGIVLKEDYLMAIRTVAEDMKKANIQIKYIPHRAESSLMLKEIAGIIPLHNVNGPIEYAFLKQGPPNLVVGNFSSALFTISRIYTNTVVVSYLFNEKVIKGSPVETKKDIVRIQNEILLDPIIESRKLPVSFKIS